MRLAPVSLLLLLVLAICSVAALAQPTIYILSVKESQGWWTDPQLLTAKTRDYLQRAGKALGLSLSIEVIDSIEKWEKFVDEAPPNAVIINAHGELVPVPPRYGSDWQSFFRDLAVNIKYRGWVLVNPVGYGFFYVTYNYTRRPDGTWKWEFLKVDTAGLDTLGKWLGMAATAWPDPSGGVPRLTELGKLVFDALGYSMPDTANAPRPLTTNASASWYFYVLRRGNVSTYACAGFVVGRGALLWGGWADGWIEEHAKVAVAMTLYHLFPVEIRASQAQPRASRFDLKKLVSFVASLQGEDGYFMYSPGSSRRGPIETLLALEILSEIGADLKSTINVDRLRENLEWHWGYTIGGAWQPSAGVQAMNIVSYSLLGTAPPTAVRDYFVNLARESQNPDGGIRWYKGGDSALWSTYFTVKALKALNALNAVDVQAVLSYVKQSLVNYESLTPEDLYYALSTLDLLNKKNELDPRLGNEVYDWLKRLYYPNYKQTYYVLASMRILKEKAECNEAEAVELLRKYYDPDTGGFQWLLANYSLAPDVEHTWAAVKLLELLPGVKLENYKVRFYVYVQTPFSAIEGGGWYDEGTSATVRVLSTIVQASGEERFVFDGWGGDITGKDPVIMFTVDKPMTIYANWKKQYYVEAYSDFSSFEGVTGWYDEGSYVRLKLRETALGFPIRKVFDHFEGLTPSDTVLSYGEVSILVDGPRKVRAVWRTDYTPLFLIMALTGVAVSAALVVAIAKKRGAERVAYSARAKELIAELKKYESYLSRLEEMRRNGLVSDRVYEALKREYQGNIERIKEEIKKFKSPRNGGEVYAVL